MKTITSINDSQFLGKTIITIGTFDGVHLGHKKILEKVVAQAKAANLESVVLTFFPHPRMVLQEKSEIKLLNTINEKIQLFDQLGIDCLIIHPFDYEFSRLTAEEFVKTILIDKFNIQKIIIGYDHRFGRNRTANIDDLIVYGNQYDFEVEQISVEEINEIAISSTKIRTAILEGNINLANQYLGYEYSFSGTVIKGKQLGRTIGFPTANISNIEDYKLLPKKGVYVVKSIINGQLVFGMMNIGNRPTVDGEGQTVEVHFLDFNADLYNQNIEIALLHYIREEIKFNLLDDLKAQIAKDQLFAQDFVATL
ncbi:MAG: bifunctional riboflavin kinase/FAD synthetase [Bacteroidota bacterium]